MSWALVTTLVNAGHEVIIVTTPPSRFGDSWGEAIKALNRIGVKCVVLTPVKTVQTRSRILSYWRLLKRAMFAGIADFYMIDSSMSREFEKILQTEKPHLLYLYTVQAVAITAPIQSLPPRIAALVDLDHLTCAYRRQWSSNQSSSPKIVSKFHELAERRLSQIIVDLLKKCECVIDHAAHHASWLRSRGVTKAIYLPNPVLDVTPGMKIHHESAGRKICSGKPRFVLLGNLEGIATLAGLHLFASEIVPELERLLGKEGFEISVVGKGSLPSSLSHLLLNPAITFKGFVPDLSAELFSCHALLVPTQIELGFRTRIAEAFSYGCCVVAHVANQEGMPEIIHEVNALVAASGKSLAQELVRVAHNPALRQKLMLGARETYEKKLNGTEICKQIVSEMEQLVVKDFKQPHESRKVATTRQDFSRTRVTS